MKILSINIRGLGGLAKKDEIKKLIDEEKPDCIFIQETKMEVIDHNFCYSLWGNNHCDWAFVPSIGRSGGLLSVWGLGAFSISSSFSGTGYLGISGVWSCGVQCSLVNIYSPCDLEGKRSLWSNLIREMQNRGGECWCLIGDFNAVKSTSERRGRSPPNFTEIIEFSNFIESAGLFDIPLAGRKYTYYSPDGLSLSRIDRCLLSEGWMSNWPELVQRGLPYVVSDHTPLVVFDKNVNWGPKPFKSLDCWFDHPKFRVFVVRAWEEISCEGTAGFVLKEKLKALKAKLKVWNKECFGMLDSKIHQAREELEEVDRALDANNLSEADLNRRRDTLASFVFQQSRSKWVRLGETNSKFFHNSVKQRRRRNEISGIPIQGRWSEDVQEVKTEIFNHFADHYSNVAWDRPTLDGISFKQVSDSDNAILTAPFSEDEIKAAVWDCGSDKSPGSDGFNFRFIKEFWNTIKPEICAFIHEFYESGKLVRGFNPSFVTLIPKVENPVQLKDYRPISLISSMYKILAKLLARRLSPVLQKVISESQSAFLPSRNIADGILISNEAIDEAQSQHRGLVIFKVDFEKAFDSVQWSFLDHMLLKLGFCSKWRGWIQECISTATISILVNGSPTKEFPLSRGLRQGDPLSPLLFLVAAEGLTGMVRKAVSLNFFESFDVGSQNVAISHLQYADDTIFLTRPSLGNIWAVKAILRLFELCSGLKVNFNKSTLFSINAEEEFVGRAMSILHCKSGSVPFSYLGIPVGANPGRLSTWTPLLDLFRRKLSSWKNNVLSFGGRIILLKSVISSLPIYFFSFYLAPVTIIKKLRSLQIRFIWGG